MLKYFKEETSKTQVYTKEIKNCIRVVNIQQVLKFILNLVSSLTFGIIYHL